MKRLAFLLLLTSLACNDQREQPVTQTRAAATPASPSDEGRKLIAQYGCNGCHIVPGIEGAQGTLGPSLAGVASRPTLSEGSVPNSPANLAQFIQNPASLNAQSSMPPTGVTDEEASAIAAYLATLK